MGQDQPALPAPFRLAIAACPTRRLGPQGRPRPASARRTQVNLAMDAWFAKQAERSGEKTVADAVLDLPVKKPKVTVPVVELFLQ